jgi:hypothetical protein
VRDQAGTAHQVTAFSRFACAEPLRGSAVRYPERRGFQYHYDDLINDIEG